MGKMWWIELRVWLKMRMFFYVKLIKAKSIDISGMICRVLRRLSISIMKKHAKIACSCWDI